MSQKLVSHWYRPRLTPLTFSLSPLGKLFSLVAARRAAQKICPSDYPCPVVVVGNITVGGTGKTPFLIYLAGLLQEQGFHCAVISRGYGGHSDEYPLKVTPEVAASCCGDEPRLIADALPGVSVVVSPERKLAADWLVRHEAPDIIFSDDGLQHYGLPRDYEIVLLDQERGWGNGRLLPAGPLREKISRLETVNRVYLKSSGPLIPDSPWAHFPAFRVIPAPLQPVCGQRQPCAAGSEIHAVAGIANPEPFFSDLEARGFRVHRHAFADHHDYKLKDFASMVAGTIVMTAKDWVKCQRFGLRDVWLAPVRAQLDYDQEHDLTETLQALILRRQRSRQGEKE